jgi:hypothetical protein
VTDPTPTPDDLAAAADQLRSAPAPGIAPPSEAEVAASLAARQAAGPAGLTGADVDQLLAGIKALQARVDALESEKAAGAAVPAVSGAETMRDLIRTHAAMNPGTDHGDLIRLADDAVDAAGNAAESGQGSELAKIAARVARALHKVHPGPGDHHYWRQALGFAEVHLPDAADALVPRPQQAPAGAVSSDRAPARVVAGSVTG